MWAVPIRVRIHVIQTGIVEVVEAEATEALLANDLDLIFEGLPSLLVLDKLLQDHVVHLVLVVGRHVVDLDSVDY